MPDKAFMKRPKRLGIRSKGLINGARRRIADTKLKNKLLISIIPLSVLSCAIVFLFSLYTGKRYEEKIYQVQTDNLDLIINGIEEDLNDIKASAYSVGENIFVKRFMRYEETKEDSMNYTYISLKRDVYDSMVSCCKNNGYISAITILTQNKHLTAGRAFTEGDKTFLEAAWKSMLKNNLYYAWMPGNKTRDSLSLIIRIRETEDLSLRDLGILVIDINLKNIVSKHLGGQEKGTKIDTALQILQGDSLIYSYGPLKTKIDLKEKAAYFKLNYHEINYFVTQVDASSIGWRYVTFLNYNQVTGSTSNLKLVFCVVMIVNVILVIIVCYCFTARIIKQFNLIVMKIKNFRQGRFIVKKEDVDTARKDEIGYINNNLDNLIIELQELIRDNYIKQLLIRESHLKTLKQQLNPHFLFNTLQTVSWKAKINDQNELGEIVDSLGKLLRYTLQEDEDLILLKSELEIVYSYIRIQQYRYGERLQVEYAVAEPLLKEQVPKLAIQNVVENAVKYALENMLGTCVIRLWTEEDDKGFYLYVEDNGPGIKEELLNRDEEETNIFAEGIGIGLNNIKQRMRILYSKEFKFEVRNTGHGTRAEFYLPKAVKEMEG